MRSDPCERCGDVGCSPRFHSEAGSDLVMVTTGGALVGVTLVGLALIPLWIRRQVPITAPPGHPAHRLRRDRVVTALLAGAVMAIVTLSAGIVATAAPVDRGPRAWSSPTFPDGGLVPQPGEVRDVLAYLEAHPRSEMGREHLVQAGARMASSEVPLLTEAHDGWARWLDPARDHHARNRRAVRDALRASPWPEAALALGLRYDADDVDRQERESIARHLGACLAPRGLAHVLDAEAREHRLPRVAAWVQPACAPAVAQPLLRLAAIHPSERAAAYRALAAACDRAPLATSETAGVGLVDHWLAADERSLDPFGRRALAHALACGEAELLPRALAADADAEPEARAELALVRFRRGELSWDELSARLPGDPVLRAVVDDFYAGSAPWEDRLASLLGPLPGGRER